MEWSLLKGKSKFLLLFQVFQVFESEQEVEDLK